MNKKTNMEFLENLRDLGVLSPDFETYTANWTKEKFNNETFEALEASDEGVKILNEYYGLSIKSVLNSIEGVNAVDTLAEQDFSQDFQNGFGALLQRIQIGEIKPVSPAFVKLEKYGSVDPFIIRPPKSNERFFKQNFDYQNFITITDDEARKIFINETGMYDYIQGILANLNNAFEVQKYLVKLEAINAGINSVKYPLQNSQIKNISMSATPTEAELKEFLLTIKNLIGDMRVKPMTAEYNAMKFSRKQNIDDLRLLIKPELLNIIDVNLLASIFNPEKLNINLKFVQVENFGGIYYTDDSDNRLYPLYDEIGCEVGLTATEGGTEPYKGTIKKVDPNENVLALLCDKGYVFTSTQVGYQLRSIMNPRGLYTNYFASKPNGGCYVDYAFTVVKFVKDTTNKKK